MILNKNNFNLNKMKYIITFLLICFSTSLFSQVKLFRKTKDDFTGGLTISTSPYKKKFPKKKDRIDKQQLLNFSLAYMQPKAQDKGLYYVFVIFNANMDVGCFSEYDGKLMFLLSNGTVIECIQKSDTDCSDMPNGTFALFDEDVKTYAEMVGYTNENIELLLNNDIKKIRIYSTNGYYDFEMKDENKDIFKQHYEVIQNEM